MKRLVVCLAALLTITVMMSSCCGRKTIELKPYPATERGEVVDNYFGTEVADPYRWLEDDNAPETAEWVKAQNDVTFDYLAQISYRDKIRERLTQLWNYPKEGTPSRHGDWYYYFYNDGLKNQSVLYRKPSLDAEGEVFLDPNTLSDEGTVALSAVAFSKDGKYMAYSVASAGSDWVEIHVIDTESGEQLADKIEWVKFSGASWAPDGKGFYYSAYDKPEKGVFSSQNQFQKVYYHKLGDAQSADELIYWDAQHPLRYFSGEESGDGKWQFVHASEGTSGSEVLYRKKGERKFRTLLEGFAYDYSIVTVEGDYAYVLTNDAAPNFRLAKINLVRPAGLEDVIAENPEVLLETVSAVGGVLVATYMENAMNKVRQYEMSGELIREVELPAIGTVSGFGGEKEDTTVFYSVNGFTAPATSYVYDLRSGETTLYKQPEVSYDPELFTSSQVFFTSKDGTQVPMFLVHRKDMKLNGKNPVYLYGYGGFNISYTPSFSPNHIMFMEQGGVYAQVTLRGGGEYGEKWHKAGMLENKQNVFDDFIAAAEYLIAEGYTSSDKLAIAGGSNGGLLVGACEVQRPDLYAVCLPAVGVLDMLRYHKFTIGWGWAVEYGSSEYEDQFEYIYKYSPLHNIKDGVKYPATLVTTGDHDDRVVPAHSFKFAAQMQHSQAGEAPVLIRIETNAGHGAGKPTSKRIDEATDIYSFLFWNTDHKYKEIK